MSSRGSPRRHDLRRALRRRRRLWRPISRRDRGAPFARVPRLRRHSGDAPSPLPSRDSRCREAARVHSSSPRGKHAGQGFTGPRPSGSDGSVQRAAAPHRPPDHVHVSRLASFADAGPCSARKLARAVRKDRCRESSSLAHLAGGRASGAGVSRSAAGVNTCFGRLVTRGMGVARAAFLKASKGFTPRCNDPLIEPSNDKWNETPPWQFASHGRPGNTARIPDMASRRGRRPRVLERLA